MVSIPFKRETAFKLSEDIRKVNDEIVSIPFKRETAFKQSRMFENTGRPVKFQFPSNGKLHSNAMLVPFFIFGTLWVSIPFKRETAFKPVLCCMIYAAWTSFNSLQTGNCIQTRKEILVMKVLITFQFPSNGKLHSNDLKRRRICRRNKVSIPFKRETAFKPIAGINNLTGFIQFQFPSNGKLHSNCQFSFRLRLDLSHVSIPFKRETAFKLSGSGCHTKVLCVSIPFKRETAFKPLYDVKGRLWFEEFQFPSNGKLHSNPIVDGEEYHGQYYVSIPFKRETAFKRLRSKMDARESAVFQFPSNGKLHSNVTTGLRVSPCIVSFNSLQTGNCIQTIF